MAIELATKLNTKTPDGEYIYGNIRDDNGTGNGTDVDTINHADFHQFFARLFAISGKTYNGLPDNDYNDFQYFEALQEIVCKDKSFTVYVNGHSFTDQDYGKMNVQADGSNHTFTMPPSDAKDYEKRMVIMNIGSGVLSIVPDGADVFFFGNIDLLQGDVVELALDGTAWYVRGMYRFPASVALTEAGVDNKHPITPATLKSKKLEHFDAGPIGIASTGYVDLTGFSFTTPNDGITRQYLILFHCNQQISNGSTVSYGVYKIYNSTDAVDIQFTSAGKAGGAFGDNYVDSISILDTVSIGPNKTIKVAGLYVGAGVTISNIVCKLIAIRTY